METKLMRKSFSITLIIVLLCSIVLQFGNTVRAAEVPGNVITKAWVTDAEGKPFKPGQQVGAWQSFRIYAKFKLPDNLVKENDTTTMTLPFGIDTAPPDKFQIKDGDEVIANATMYNDNPARIELKYTKYAETHSDIQGEFYFNVAVNAEKLEEPSKIPVTLTVNGKAIPAGEVDYKPPHFVNTQFSKVGWMTSDKTEGKYDIRINQDNVILQNAKFEDTLQSEGVSFIQGSLEIWQGEWENRTTYVVLKDKKNVTQDFKNAGKIKFDGKKLTIDIGSIDIANKNRGFQILYKVKLNYDPIAGEEIKNKANLTYGSEIFDKESIYKIKDAGGIGEGYVYKIRVNKTGQDGAPLAGAEFDVIRVRNNQKVGTIKSGTGGKGEIGKLLRDTYKLVETKAPEGYMPLTEPIMIEPADFGTNKIAERTIENKKNPKINICGEKTWDDANNQDKKRPDKITVILHANGEPIQNPDVRPDENGKWRYSFTGLPKYDDKGKEITYTVKEEPVAGYTSKVEGYNITNSYKPEETSVKVTKKWEDAGNQDGKRPENIKVQLYGNDKKVEDEVTLNEGNGWTHTWTKLPKNADGNPIKYTVKEVGKVDNYTTSYGEDSQGNLTICNKHTPEKTKIEGEKTWNDANDQDGKRPESINVQLYGNDEKVGDEVELKKATGWTHTWNDLPEKKAGKTIKYTVKEVGTVEGYETSYNDANHGNIIITNKYTPEKTKVEGKKTWDDVDNQDRKRPEEITVNLLQNGAKFKSVTVKPDADGNWKYEFTNLDKYENGKEIKYTVTEDTVKDYNFSSEGYNIKNSYTPKETSVTVTKRWNDSNDKDKLRPESIKVQLYANGEKKGEAVELKADSNWSHTWNNLPEKVKGKDIKYTVKEVDKLKGYTVSVDDNDHGNIIITNTHTPKEITHPKTGDINKLITYAMMLFASLIVLMGMIVSRIRVAN